MNYLNKDIVAESSSHKKWETVKNMAKDSIVISSRDIDDDDMAIDKMTITTSTNKASKFPDFFRICVEGNIACGKTFLCKSLANHFKEDLGYVVHILEEEIDVVLLEKFNSDPIKYAFQFQESMAAARIRALTLASKLLILARETLVKTVIIVDTGPIREAAFTNANYEMNNIERHLALAHLDRFKNSLLSKNDPHTDNLPEFIVLIDLPIEKVMSGIKRRNRLNENLLTREYLEKIKDAHHYCKHYDWFETSGTKICTFLLDDYLKTHELVATLEKCITISADNSDVFKFVYNNKKYL